MSVRGDNGVEYIDRFGTPEPGYYMRHLSDEEYNAMIVKALHDNSPIDPEALVKNVPTGAYI